MNTIDTMFKKLQKIRKKSYAPYSNFHVGACILTGDGSYHVGTNVENAAYPQGVCAEASAISAMVGEGHTTIHEIGIIGEGLCTPCGGCRQKIREFATDGCKIHIFNENGFQKTFTLGELLPESFGPDNLA